MSVFTLETAATNPIGTSEILAIDETFGVKEQDTQSLEDYTKLLGVFHDACQELMDMDDYMTSVNEAEFPREEIHYPSSDENKLNAWGYKFNIGSEISNANNKPLAGKNVALKDCIAVADVPMLLGTAFIENYVPKVDATVVTRLLKAGASIKGKAVCENLCHSSVSHSAATGPIHNPLAHGYSAGGSSSGSAALVADANENIHIAIGADQGGSVRLPAAACGIVGIKPTFGLIPFTGCASNEATNDHLGVMTKDVLTNALGLQAIAGSDGIDDRGFNCPTEKYFDILKDMENPKNLNGVKIALLKEGFYNDVMDPRVSQTCIHAVEKFKELGATVTEVSIPFHLKGPLIWTGISKVGGYLTKVGCSVGRRGLSLNDLNEKFLKAYQDQDRWDKAYPSTKNIYYNGAYAVKTFPLLYGKCMNLSRKLRDEYNKVLEQYDVLILPTTPRVAESHAPVTDNLTPLKLLEKQMGYSFNTAGFDQSGHPVLSLPCGMLPVLEGPLAGSGTRLPVSFQIVGKWYEESMIYRVAYAWEQANDWKSL